jgi:hypothetical protein
MLVQTYGVIPSYVLNFFVYNYIPILYKIKIKILSNIQGVPDIYSKISKMSPNFGI